MLVADEDRRFIDANPGACEALGASHEAILTRTIDDFTTTDDGFSVDDFWTTLMHNGRLNGRYPAKRLDGAPRPIVYAATSDVLPGRHMGVFMPIDLFQRAQHENGSDGSRERPLTGRECDVLRLIADGLTDRQIAARLQVAPDTARTHTRNALEKLNAHTRAQAVALAIRRGDL
jgi:DNA-binding CsgD family transcriptional regulator